MYLYGTGSARRIRPRLGAYIRRTRLGDDLAPLPVEASSLPTTDVFAQPQPYPAPPSSIDAAYKNLLTQQQSSQSPLDYVSPQAAIAAGLNAQTVYNAWSGALAKFPTQQAALAAGVPPGVVTQLWMQSRQTAATQPTSFLDQAPLGIANKYVLGGGAVLVALASLRRK